MNSIVELSEAARRCSNVDYRMTMQEAVKLLTFHSAAFWREPTAVNLTALNGAWAHADRVFKNTPPEAPPAPNAGAGEAPKLAMAA